VKSRRAKAGPNFVGWDPDKESQKLVVILGRREYSIRGAACGWSRSVEFQGVAYHESLGNETKVKGEIRIQDPDSQPRKDKEVGFFVLT